MIIKFYQDWLQIGCNSGQLQDWLFLQLFQQSWESISQDKLSVKEQLFCLFVSDRHTCQACTLVQLFLRRWYPNKIVLPLFVLGDSGLCLCPVCGPILDMKPWEHPSLMSEPQQMITAISFGNKMGVLIYFLLNRKCLPSIDWLFQLRPHKPWSYPQPQQFFLITLFLFFIVLADYCFPWTPIL